METIIMNIEICGVEHRIEVTPKPYTKRKRSPHKMKRKISYEHFKVNDYKPIPENDIIKIINGGMYQIIVFYVYGTDGRKLKRFRPTCNNNPIGQLKPYRKLKHAKEFCKVYQDHKH